MFTPERVKTRRFPVGRSGPRLLLRQSHITNWAVLGFHFPFSLLSSLFTLPLPLPHLLFLFLFSPPPPSPSSWSFCYSCSSPSKCGVVDRTSWIKSPRSDVPPYVLFSVSLWTLQGHFPVLWFFEEQLPKKRLTIVPETRCSSGSLRCLLSPRPTRYGRSTVVA